MGVGRGLVVYLLEERRGENSLYRELGNRLGVVKAIAFHISDARGKKWSQRKRVAGYGLDFQNSVRSAAISSHRIHSWPATRSDSRRHASRGCREKAVSA